MYYAIHIPGRGWRIRYNDIDICGAINEQVARETAAALAAYRAVMP